MDRGNKLWTSHRFYLPEMLEKLARCKNCVFLIWIKGREETRPGCVVCIEEYSNLKKSVPRELSAMELMRKVGKEKLLEIVNKTEPNDIACGLFRRIPEKKN